MSKPNIRTKMQSIKDGASSHKGKKPLSGKLNLGDLARKNREVNDVLYAFVTNADWVFEDMDYTIEEFSDITGADIEELLVELGKVVKVL